MELSDDQKKAALARRLAEQKEKAKRALEVMQAHCPEDKDLFDSIRRARGISEKVDLLSVEMACLQKVLAHLT